jgi:integrase
VPRWNPYRLRHNAATNLRREYGIDVARIILGHKLGSKITEVYAEADVALARKVMGEVG